jgi:hypothetical protein
MRDKCRNRTFVTRVPACPGQEFVAARLAVLQVVADEGSPQFQRPVQVCRGTLGRLNTYMVLLLFCRSFTYLLYQLAGQT